MVDFPGARIVQPLNPNQGTSNEGEQSSRSVGDQVAHSLGVGTRDVIEGATALPGMALDAATWPFRAFQRAIGLPTTAPSDLVNRGLTATGLPEPENDAERLRSAAIRGGSAALTTAGVGSVPSVAAAVPTAARVLTTAIPSQVVGGATGGAAGEATRQAGGGPLLQFGASILGGGLGAAATQGVQLGGRAVNSLLMPFTQRGREGIVTDVMLGGSSQPNSLLARLRQGADEPRLPGSPVTTATQARDPGLLAIELGQRSDVVGTGTPGGVSPAARFRDVDAQRNQVRTTALDAMADTSDPGARGAVVRGALETGEDAMRKRVGQLFTEAEPAGGGSYPIERIKQVATDVTAKFSPERMGGGVPPELQAVIDDISAAPGGAMTFEQIQNVRSRLGKIAGEARGKDNRISDAAGAIVRALETEADSPAWQAAISARRQMGTALGRDEAGASATGQILKTDRYGSPMLPDEQVANRAISSVGNVRQTLGAVDKAVQDAQTANLGAEQIAALQKHAADTRTALQGQFIANLTKRVQTSGGLADAAGNVSTQLSPAQFAQFMKQNAGIAAELFSPQQLANLRTLTADFAETAMQTATPRAAGSPTAQNLSVGAFISRATRGLVDPGHPMAQTVASLGPVMRWIYAAPEVATREMLTEAMVNPKFAEALLARASPETMRRAIGYVEQTMGERLRAAAKDATVRQDVRSMSGEANRQQMPAVQANPLMR